LEASTPGDEGDRPPIHLVERAAKIPTNLSEYVSPELSNPSRDRIPSIFGDKDQVIIETVNTQRIGSAPPKDNMIQQRNIHCGRRFPELPR
jgi:hypothetical protein